MDYTATVMDIELSKIYDREYIRNNDRTYLNGDICQNKLWQSQYRKIISYLLC